MLQWIKVTVNSTLADFDGSLERDILSALSIVVKTQGSWFLSLLNEEKKKVFKDGNTGGSKTNSTNHQQNLFGATSVFHSIDFYIRITSVIYQYKCFS